jgi:hypothetical protein
MSATIKQTSIALLSVVSLLGISNATVAASFTFKLDNRNFTNEDGTLKFTISPLTGIGAESIALNQLPDAIFSFHPVYSPYGFSYKQTGEPVFDFQDGNLVGIHSSYADHSYYPSPGRYPAYADAYLNLNGNSWAENIWIYIQPYNSPPITVDNIKDSGSISFQTIDPVIYDPVPEASNALGVFLGLAGILGFRTRFKK